MGIGSIPNLKRNPNGILALVLCILLGGIGAIIIGAIDDNGNDKKAIIITGILMFIGNIVFGLGWVWAVVWGALSFARSS